MSNVTLNCTLYNICPLIFSGLLIFFFMSNPTSADSSCSNSHISILVNIHFSADYDNQGHMEQKDNELTIGVLITERKTAMRQFVKIDQRVDCVFQTSFKQQTYAISYSASKQTIIDTNNKQNYSISTLDVTCIGRHNAVI